MTEEQENIEIAQQVRKHYKPQLKPLSKGKLIDIILELSIQVAVLNNELKEQKNEK